MRRPIVRSRAWKLLLLVSLTALLWAIRINGLGGVESRLFGVRVSSRDPYRATLVALVTGIAGVTLLGYGIPRSHWKRLWASMSRGAIRTAMWCRAIAAAAAPAIAPAAAVIVLIVGLKFGARVAGGADTYGYVSQAYLWLDGELRIQQPFAGTVPWPNADWTLTPLGYRPGTTPHTLVPIYSPGLPLIMAGFTRIIGSCGPYYIMPLAAATLVFLTYLLGRHVAGVNAGSIAALLMATSPIMLFQMMMPMTDVIVATLWTASLLLAFRPSNWSIVCSGLVCGLAILVRPNLVLLAAIPLLIVVWRAGAIARALTGGLSFGVAMAPGILLVAAINNYLFGSPSESGYGSVGSIYSAGNLRANLARYPAWLLESQGPLIVVFLTALFRMGRTGRNELPWRGLFLLFIALLLLPYLFYIPFDAWWYLRFVLPAFPIIFILAADALLWMTRRLPGRWGTIALLMACAWMMFSSLRFTLESDLPGLGAGEQRYADVGRFIARELPAKSVCLAMQHSGSIRHYSHCTTLRYDILRPEWLDRAIAHLVQRGYHPYIVLDDWEEEPFRQRFKAHSPLGSLEWTPLAALDGGHVRIYDATERYPGTKEKPLMRIPVLSRAQCLGRADSR
jgi:hypothetical protein